MSAYLRQSVRYYFTSRRSTLLAQMMLNRFQTINKSISVLLFFKLVTVTTLDIVLATSDYFKVQVNKI